ncbi:DnaJ domain containing protein, putative [Babesia bigemina]|uniref:DnaJ domain containing protein, putative n=1 Tax=Babesia bigemina TaxID=5866 RepID=A0A061DE84_BABBI|nr:DnaJ domain containing protein, putative [Babesia bigemina]CDR96915.1 DnaJ domain containing protein, putative [Babesia bigemina]|eukprot:XP_012769101.1 DnaJ domain containing protein, putative [Babesia bigemina]
MPWPLVAVACGSGILLGRYLYRRLPAQWKLLSRNPGQLTGVGIMGGRLGRMNLRGFEQKMTYSEACSILNVSSTASKDKIRENYKQLMMRNHPDNGGSTYIASKVNEAKDYLLK